MEKNHATLFGIIPGSILTVSGISRYISHNTIVVMAQPVSAQLSLVNWDVGNVK